MATALQIDHPDGTELSRDDYILPLHGAMNLGRLLAGHVALVIWFLAGFQYLPVPVYIGLSIILCQFHQRELNDWAHEACHWNLVPSRRWNDRLGHALASFWFGVRLLDLRRSHFLHHQTETFFEPGDPETGGLTITSRRELVGGILEDLSGISALKHYVAFLFDPSRGRGSAKKGGGKAVPWPMLRVVSLHLVIFAGLIWVGRWDVYVIYYGTMMTVYRLSHRIRIYAQHLHIPDSGVGTCHDSVVARTVRANWLSKMIFASDVMLYHNEHHKHPELPYRALRKICVRKPDVNVYVEEMRPIERALAKM